MPVITDQPKTKPKSGHSPTFELEPIPRYAVILHNDDVHSMEEVVVILIKVFQFDADKAVELMLEAHYTGRSTVMVTHFERAELYRDKLRSYTLSSTIEKLD